MSEFGVYCRQFVAVNSLLIVFFILCVCMNCDYYYLTPLLADILNIHNLNFV